MKQSRIGRRVDRSQMNPGHANLVWLTAAPPEALPR